MPQSPDSESTIETLQAELARSQQREARLRAEIMQQTGCSADEFDEAFYERAQPVVNHRLGNVLRNGIRIGEERDRAVRYLQGYVGLRGQTHASDCPAVGGRGEDSCNCGAKFVADLSTS